MQLPNTQLFPYDQCHSSEHVKKGMCKIILTYGGWGIAVQKFKKWETSSKHIEKSAIGADCGASMSQVASKTTNGLCIIGIGRVEGAGRVLSPFGHQPAPHMSVLI